MNPGKISENVLKRSVLKNINNKSNGAGLDCAIFTGYVANESEPACASHAIIRACNNASVAGYRANMVALSVSMPEHMREIKLKNIIREADNTAQKLGVIIKDGHTETVAGLTYPIVTATVVASLLSPANGRESAWRPVCPKPGQAIVMTKWMAMSGGARIARVHKDELLTRLPEYIVDDAIELEQFMSVAKEAAVAVRSDAICMNDCSDGGIFAALWQLGDINGVGLSVNLRDIPVRQETIEVCEFYDINPYKLRSDGSVLIVTDAPDALIEALAKENVPGTKIGEITNGIDRVIISGDDRRFLEEPRQDEGVML